MSEGKKFKYYRRGQIIQVKFEPQNNPKTKALRDSTNKKRFTTMIKYLSKEKGYTNMM